MKPDKDDIAQGWTPLGLKWLADGAPWGACYLKWRQHRPTPFSPDSAEAVA